MTNAPATCFPASETEARTFGGDPRRDLRQLHSDLHLAQALRSCNCVWVCGPLRSVRNKEHLCTNTARSSRQKNTFLSKCCLSLGFVNKDELISQHFILQLISLHVSNLHCHRKGGSTMCFIPTVCRRLAIGGTKAAVLADWQGLSWVQWWLLCTFCSAMGYVY